MVHGLALRLALGLLFGGLACPAAIAEDISLRVIGPPETVYDWSEDRCGLWDIPDTPVRFWRSEDGRVHRIFGAEQNRKGSGAKPGEITHNCQILFSGSEDPDPATFDDHIWISTILANAQGSVSALGHVEYHGHLRPDRCASRVYRHCWHNTLIELALRHDGTFARAPGSEAMVASLPHPYAGDLGRRTGYFNPSNALERDGYFYVYFFAERYLEQKRGVCVMRRPVSGGASDWRAWDGQSFSVIFKDPYRDIIPDADRHVCQPLSNLRSTLSGVVRLDSRNLYLGVSAWNAPERFGGTGIYLTTSSDLITWNQPRPLLKLPLLWDRECQAPAAYAYPTLVDEDSARVLFDEVSNRFWLYLVRMQIKADCQIGPQRDLVRFPLAVSSPL
jgi:hypothetical protein